MLFDVSAKIKYLFIMLQYTENKIHFTGQRIQEAEYTMRNTVHKFLLIECTVRVANNHMGDAYTNLLYTHKHKYTPALPLLPVNDPFRLTNMEGIDYFGHQLG